MPHHQSELLYDALKTAGVRVRFHTLEGAGHGDGFGGQELEAMVRGFFDRHLNGEPATDDEPLAAATRSPGIASPAVGRPPLTRQGPGRPVGIPWEVVRRREDVNADGQVTRHEFRGPPPLFDRLDHNRDGVLTKADFEDATPVGNGDNLTP